MAESSQKFFADTWNLIIIGVIGLAVIAIWVVLKLIGIINTPVWVNMIPIIAGVVVVGSLLVSIGKMIEKLNRVCIDTRKMRKDLDVLRVNCPACKE